MGLFNVLNADLVCPACHQAVPFRIQFKYGATRQHEYKLGDTLHWKWNCEEKKAARRFWWKE